MARVIINKFLMTLHSSSEMAKHVFPSRYGNTSGSLGKKEMVLEHEPIRKRFQSSFFELP